jgi:AcrR family transcriptional regulator
VSAPTARIAKEAGVAEGTLFTYFATKDELLNRLYLELKMDLRDAMMTDYPAGKSLIVRNRHVWDRFIGWGSAPPLKRRAMRQLAVSDRITEESKKLIGDAFGEFDDMMRECAVAGAMHTQEPCFLFGGQPNPRGGVLVVHQKKPPFVRDPSPPRMTPL